MNSTRFFSIVGAFAAAMSLAACSSPPSQGQRTCVDDSECSGGACVDGVCVVAGGGGGTNGGMNGGGGPMCDNPGPCGDCDLDCSIEGSGAGTGSGFAIDQGGANGVVLGDDGAVTLAVDELAPGKKIIWIANTGQGTVSRVDTETYQELGRYFTGPAGAGNDPSRTSVNTFGDVFVGNRSGGGGTRIIGGGPEGCPDANGDGTVTTSTGASDLKAWGADECVAWHTPLCNDSCLIRAVAAQDVRGADGAVTPVVWFGGFNNNTIYKLDGRTGEILLTTRSPVRPYGFALDKDANLWISGPNWGFANEGRGLGRIDTTRCVDDMSCNVDVCGEDGDDCIKQRIPLAEQPYGITVDFNQRVWMGGEHVFRYDPAAALGSRWSKTEVGGFVSGITADESGFVYAAAHSLGVSIHDGSNPGSWQFIPGTTGLQNKGLAVDLGGKIWSDIQDQAGQALVIQPGATIADASVTATVSGFVAPYTYSDMTGSQLRLATDQLGYFRQTFESCQPANEFIGTTWKEVRWDAEVPADSSITIRVRAAFTAAELEGTDWVTIATLPSATNTFDLGPLFQEKGWQNAGVVQVEAQLGVVREPDVTPTPPKLKALSVTKSCPRLIN